MSRWLSDLGQDVRYSFRLLARAPVFSATCLMTLAVTLGANSAMFSVVDRVLLRDLPLPHAERLVDIALAPPAQEGKPRPEMRLDLQQIEGLEEGAPGIADIAGYQVGRVTWRGGDVPRRLTSARVSPSFFRVLGVTALRGRVFDWAGGRLGSEPAVLVSQRLWQEGYAERPSLVGEPLVLDGTPHTVIGILPRGFGFPDAEVDVWLPLVADPGAGNGAPSTTEYVPVVARLADGASIEEARLEAQAVLDQLQTRSPGRVVVIPLGMKLTASVRSALWTLYAAVFLVLLIAAVNLANLVMAHNLGRQQELALRAALGGGRGRLLRQLVTESLVLSVLGGVLGLFVAFWIDRILPRVLPPDLPRIDELGLDLRTFGFTLALALVMGSLFGVLPAIRGVSRPRLRRASGGTTEGSPERASRRLLVVIEVALAVVVMIGSALLFRNFLNLTSIDPGFEPNHVLVATVDLGERYPSQGQRIGFFDRLVDRLEGHRLIESAGLVSYAPLGPGFSMTSLQVVGQPAGRTLAVPQATNPAYLSAVGMRVRAGRWISQADHASGSPVVVVNQAFVKRYLVDGKAVGRHLQVAGDELRIVGVVDDVRLLGLVSDPRPELYTSFHRNTPASLTLAIRTHGEPADVVPFLRTTLAELDPNLALENAGSLSAELSASLARPRFYALLFGIFGGMGIFLATIGLYGVLAELVLRQRRSIGVRRALGARSGHVLRLVLWEGFVLMAAGMVVGGVAAFEASKLVSRLLVATSSSDPRTYLLAAICVLTFGLAACLLPARRALKIDPIEVLRSE